MTQLIFHYEKGRKVIEVDYTKMNPHISIDKKNFVIVSNYELDDLKLNEHVADINTGKLLSFEKRNDKGVIFHFKSIVNHLVKLSYSKEEGVFYESLVVEYK